MAAEMPCFLLFAGISDFNKSELSIKKKKKPAISIQNVKDVACNNYSCFNGEDVLSALR